MSKRLFRILISYHYFKSIDLDDLFSKKFGEPYPDVFADSGAYSAMTQGVNITTKEYADWVKRWSHWFSAYSNLDVIMDAEKTWENQQTLEAMGLKPLPAFHVTEDYKWLEMYIENYQYIALGVAGMQQRRDPLMRWLIRCFEIAQNKSVFHGFALTSWEVMSSFPWYSVDSSSWGQGFRFGLVPLFDEKVGKFVKIQLGDISSCRKHFRLIQDLGFDPLDFAYRERNDRANICAISAVSYMKSKEYLRKIWGDIRVYLADGSTSNLIDGNTGVKLYLVDKAGIADLISAKEKIQNVY